MKRFRDRPEISAMLIFIWASIAVVWVAYGAAKLNLTTAKNQTCSMMQETCIPNLCTPSQDTQSILTVLS